MNIKQIAKAAGVSVATVSRVLNHPENVAPATREKIQRIIDEEEYKPNWFAQGLNFNETKTIGLLLPHTLSTYCMEIANGVEDVARQKGYITFMCNTEKDPDTEKEYINQLITRKVDGIIMMYPMGLNPESERWIKSLDIPVVLIGENDTELEWDSVKVDCRKAASEMTAHLLECGHRSIAMLCGTDPEPETKAMLEGYKDVLEANGIRADYKLVFEVENNIEGGYIGMKKVIGGLIKLPDAVFATSDYIAYGAMDAIKEMGIKIPEGIAVAGFGNDRMSTLMDPKVTTVELQHRIMGIYGARVLFDRIDEKKNKDSEESAKVAKVIELQTKLRIRKSSGHSERIGEMF